MHMKYLPTSLLLVAALSIIAMGGEEPSPLCTVDADCEAVLGSLNGTCRRWECGPGGMYCTAALADDGDPCIVATVEGCVGSGPISPRSGECGGGVCTVMIPAFPSQQCGPGTACVEAQPSGNFTCVPTIAPGCYSDADCSGGGIAVGCQGVRCDLDTSTCVGFVFPDDSSCVPTPEEGAAQLCNGNQTGLCSYGHCILPEPDAASGLQCTPDAECVGAVCDVSGSCTPLSGDALLCTATLPTCADVATAVCNGWGYCTWNAACNDGNPCTDDTCNVTSQLCVNTRNRIRCRNLSAVAIVVIVFVSLGACAVFACALVPALLWPFGRRKKKRTS